MSEERVKKDLDQLQKDCPSNCTVEPEEGENGIYHWHATITGPDDTPYAKGIFHLDIQFPPDYPFKPPKVHFITPIYHCNISSNGLISLDVLQDQWSPKLTICDVLIGIGYLLTYPNPHDPMRADVAQLMNTNKAKYEEVAGVFTMKHAIP